MSVRVSATDLSPRGTTVDEAVLLSRWFAEAGADMIDCSSGEVVPDQAPVYGRMFQTPFADRIRNEAGIATIAVGAISSADEINGIIASGRADLCAISRLHLADPAWTLVEVARLGYRDIQWPAAYRAGKSALERTMTRKDL
jgi:anthraniloyl-CoA monooxygenase